MPATLDVISNFTPTAYASSKMYLLDYLPFVAMRMHPEQGVRRTWRTTSFAGKLAALSVYCALISLACPVAFVVFVLVDSLFH